MKSRKAGPLIIVGQYDITLQGRKVSYTLKQSPRIRGTRLEIHNDAGLIVVVPKRYKPGEVNDIIEKKSGWILRHLPNAAPQQIPLFRKEVDHGEKIRYMDKMIEVSVISDGHKKASACLKDNKLFICYGNGTGSRSKILEDWYRQQAAQVFKEKADKFKIEMGLSYKRIVIRGQRKRWASASLRGTLSINWKLLLTPEAVVDYVIMHELAHFKHMDHSKNFWDFLAGFCPDWRQHRKWLITHEEELKTASTFAR
ncbi:MAG: M48 family peptidase [Dehalococcoidia bacterium]|nr:MAG: M48 family peptidase [Dehalococcoidia bacterium]